MPTNRNRARDGGMALCIEREAECLRPTNAPATLDLLADRWRLGKIHSGLPVSCQTLPVNVLPLPDCTCAAGPNWPHLG